MTEQSPTPGRATDLRRGAIGVTGILFFVLSAQAPLTGIAGTLPVPLGLGNGGGAPAAYLLVGVMIGLFAVGFIAMSRHVTEAGGFYRYVTQGLGHPLGVGASQVAVLCYSATQAGMYGLYGVTMRGLGQQYFAVDLPWWLWALATMVLVQLLGSLNIELGAKLLAALVIAEVSLLLVFSVYMLFTGGGPQGLDPLHSFSASAFFAGAPGVALTFAIASMFGFESTAIYSNEAKDPVRTVPRATYLSVALISVFFAFVSWMFVSYYGAGKVRGVALDALQSGDATSVVFAPISATLGGWAADVLAVLLATSLLAGILAFHNGINRYFHSLGQTGVLPLWLSRTNRQKAPYTASLVQTVVTVCLVVPFALTGQDPVRTLLTWGGGVAVLSLMLLYILTSVAVVVFFRRTRLDTRPWNTLIAPIASVALLLGATVLALNNFTILIGASGTTALVLELSVVVVFTGGVALGYARRRPTAAASPTAPVTAEEAPASA
ncbi:APC family permease [Streptomyces sp. MA5143a]|uniref:APC family permease n=1 Tax=Streptomyces sp. MA5143a TaxID=2083010 RepID=UPI000D1B706E|nr:APC family permease [Streptomyces sp. MA5143a]SPF06391.1 Phenylalanine-specific permease [Streptomyces sp. MA5143a]